MLESKNEGHIFGGPQMAFMSLYCHLLRANLHYSSKLQSEKISSIVVAFFGVSLAAFEKMVQKTLKRLCILHHRSDGAHLFTLGLRILVTNATFEVI